MVKELNRARVMRLGMNIITTDMVKYDTVQAGQRPEHNSTYLGRRFKDLLLCYFF